MEPVGNDLVWLDDPSNQGRHRDIRLLTRILGPRERRFVEDAADPNRALWSLWAAKEAAYKAFLRTHPGAVFSPVSYQVVHGPTPCVLHENQVLPVVWSEGADWVHAAVGLRPEDIRSRVEAMPVDMSESCAVRALAARIFGEAGWPKGTIEGRPPRYLFQGAAAPPSFSLSHDGPYLAVAFRAGLDCFLSMTDDPKNSSHEGKISGRGSRPHRRTPVVTGWRDRFQGDCP